MIVLAVSDDRGQQPRRWTRVLRSMFLSRSALAIHLMTIYMLSFLKRRVYVPQTGLELLTLPRMELKASHMAGPSMQF